MNPEEIIGAFDSAVELFTQFRMKRQRQKAQTLDLIVEAQIRLKQTLHLLRLFRQRDREHHEKDLALGAVREQTLHAVFVKEVRELGEAIKLYGEAFYYFAWRACKAMEPIGLEFESKGIRDARNRLIEHPDRKGGLLVSFWVIDCAEGLVLEPGGGSKDQPRDPGLYPNAKEFIEKLLPKIERAISDHIGSN
jgi:hypothetical protein